jgi:hypothetical protein
MARIKARLRRPCAILPANRLDRRDRLSDSRVGEGVAMPLRNRVDPFGRLVAVAERGLLMGNRGGRLHDPATRMLGRRTHVSRRWIACALAFRGRRREVWGNSYTELFFCDEAVALASGHRPCFECRRSDAQAFARAFAAGNHLPAPPSADAMDLILHRERLMPLADRPVVDPGELPDGAMVAVGAEAFLIMGGRMRRFSFAGYSPAAGARSGDAPPRVRLLTPPSIVRALAAGYSPLLHPSALAG